MCSEIKETQTQHQDPLLARFVDIDFSAGAVAPEIPVNAASQSTFESDIRERTYRQLILSGNSTFINDMSFYRAQIAPQAASSEGATLAAQRDIIEKYGEMDLSINPLGVFKSAREGDGFLPSHAFALLEGYGLTMARLGGHEEIDPASGRVVKNLSEPDLLFYAPKDPVHPRKKEYVLMGWGWFSEYAPGTPPILKGTADEEWFVHESGWHTADGGFIATPPVEEFPGQVAAKAPTRETHKPGKMVLGAHPRVWDFHYWRTDLITGSETAPIAGIEAPEIVAEKMLPDDLLHIDGTPFFYPDWRSFLGNVE